MSITQIIHQIKQILASVFLILVSCVVVHSKTSHSFGDIVQLCLLLGTIFSKINLDDCLIVFLRLFCTLSLCTCGGALIWKQIQFEIVFLVFSAGSARTNQLCEHREFGRHLIHCLFFCFFAFLLPLFFFLHDLFLDFCLLLIVGIVTCILPLIRLPRNLWRLSVCGVKIHTVPRLS